MYKYCVIAESKGLKSVNYTSDFDLARRIFIHNYQSGIFANVDIHNSKTQKVYAYYHENPCELWQSKDIPIGMFDVI